MVDWNLGASLGEPVLNGDLIWWTFSSPRALTRARVNNRRCLIESSGLNRV